MRIMVLAPVDILGSVVRDSPEVVGGPQQDRTSDLPVEMALDKTHRLAPALDQQAVERQEETHRLDPALDQQAVEQLMEPPLVERLREPLDFREQVDFREA